MQQLQSVRAFDLRLTDREFAILAVSVTELLQQSYDPYGTCYIVQVEFWLLHLVNL